METPAEVKAYGQLFDSIGENIFVCNNDFFIIWVNKYADKLIEKIGSYIKITKREELIGRHIKDFHVNPAKQEYILTNVPFPYETTINLFNKFTAGIVVNPFMIHNKQEGYVLTWKDVTEFAENEKRNKKLLEELYTPIIETPIDHVYMIPIVGTLTDDRLRIMKETVMIECGKRKGEIFIIDFTGVTGLTVNSYLYELESLAEGLGLMGAKLMIAGMSAELVQNLIQRNISVNARTFGSFKQAMNDVLSIKNGKL